MGVPTRQLKPFFGVFHEIRRRTRLTLPTRSKGEELGYADVAWPSIDDYEDVSSRNQYQLALDAGKTEAEALDCVHDTGRDNARAHDESKPGTLRPLEAVVCISQ